MQAAVMAKSNDQGSQQTPANTGRLARIEAELHEEVIRLAEMPADLVKTLHFAFVTAELENCLIQLRAIKDQAELADGPVEERLAA